MRVGLCYSGSAPLKQIVESARHVDEAGWDSLWLGEDYFYRGGVTMAAAAAVATTRIRIGLGIMTPLPRHPALTAMEVAALQELSGGRIVAGVGAGVPTWMRQMGFDYRSPLTVMREGLELTRRLLQGETVDFQGKVFTLDHVKLNFSSQPPPPLYLGAVGPKALQLSGEIADGTVLSVLAGPEYVRWARERIGEGQQRSRPGRPHGLVAYVFFTLAESVKAGREIVRPVVAEYLSAGGVNPLTQHAGLPDELVRQLSQEYAAGRIASDQVPDAAIDAMAAAGPAEHCAQWIQRLAEAGADAVALLPLPHERAAEVVRGASVELVPRLKAAQAGP